ncbi:hypothetical protein JCM33374_g807 [Metschnikowia sp. JCM 33374]|nr:hypothetical protein JCM33374_g807 [Metschnikowia sp. JCM 33374]
MMAHEIPLQVHHGAPTGAKTRKHKPVHQPKFSLPNGEKPDFGSGPKDKSNKGRSPQLPNGEKPDFGGFDHKKDHSNKANGGKKTRRSSAKKSGATTPPLDVVSDSTKSDVKECYAGSSFHSSPEALALPKPSFAGKLSEITAVSPQSPQEPTPMHVGSRNVLNMPPAFVYQGMPSNGPPRYPVTAYPPSSLPGFDYNANQQGFINYSYPAAAIPQPPLPMQSYPFQSYPPIPPPPPSANQQMGGQRITFSELMGSSQ